MDATTRDARVIAIPVSIMCVSALALWLHQMSLVSTGALHSAIADLDSIEKTGVLVSAATLLMLSAALLITFTRGRAPSKWNLYSCALLLIVVFDILVHNATLGHVFDKVPDSVSVMQAVTALSLLSGCVGFGVCYMTSTGLGAHGPTVLVVLSCFGSVVQFVVDVYVCCVLVRAA